MYSLSAVFTLGEIEQLLNTVTDEQVERASQKLRPRDGDKEKEAGVINNPLTRRLWTLVTILKGKNEISLAQAGMADSEADENRFRAEAIKLAAFGAMVSHLFWLEARSECDVFRVNNIGLRTGWLLVEGPEDTRKSIIERLMGLEE